MADSVNSPFPSQPAARRRSQLAALEGKSFPAPLAPPPDPRRFALNAAILIKDSKLLPPEVQAGLTGDGLASQLQAWWETAGSSQSWAVGDEPPEGKQADNETAKP
jgi:hypothetical protein